MHRKIEIDARNVCGFGSPIASPRAWVDSSAPLLELPGEPGDVRGPLDPSVGTFAQAIVSHWPEEFGGIEIRACELADRIETGGCLLLSLQHAFAPSRVHAALDGREPMLDPHNAQSDVEIAFSIPRVVHALLAAGFVVEDVQRMRRWDHALNVDGIRSLMQIGVCATRWMYERPAERILVRARKSGSAVGSVLVSQTSDAPDRVARTHAALEFLPSTWEVVVGEPESTEATSFNAALTRSSGRVLWLVRAGDTPNAGQFERLLAATTTGPVLPEQASAGATHGLAGIMIDRALALDVGPLPFAVDSDLVAGEEWVMRIACCGPAVRMVDLEDAWQGPGVRHGASAAEDADELLSRWSEIDTLVPEMVEAPEDVAPPPWEVEARDPTITLCMIARDEERFLGDCLRSAKSCVDEIVLVDTGSTDRTVEIAESYGAVVVRSPWVDDFSVPRNVGLAHATGDWILVLDADEELTVASAQHVLDLARNERACGYHMRFINEHELGVSRGVTMVRMFRNLVGIEYRYAIHEQVVPSLVELSSTLGLVLSPSDVEVIHRGYTQDVIDTRGKKDRNLRLFLKQLADTPDNTYCLYKYGDFLRMLGRPRSEIVPVFERALELLDVEIADRYASLPFAGEVAALLGLEYLREGRIGDADRVCRAALRSFVPTPNLHYIAASAAANCGRYIEALQHYRTLLGFGDAPLVVPVQPGVTSWIALTGLASCWLALGDLDEAEHVLERAVSANPEWDPAVVLQSQVALAKGDPVRAFEVLGMRLVDFGESAVVRAHGARLLERLGQTEAAGTWALRANMLCEETEQESSEQKAVAARSVARSVPALCVPGHQGA